MQKATRLFTTTSLAVLGAAVMTAGARAQAVSTAQQNAAAATAGTAQETKQGATNSGDSNQLTPGPVSPSAPDRDVRNADQPPSIPPAQPGAAGISEVVVTGIRGSQQRAIQVKRSAINSVDAIAAEDLGKLPDQNVAESLGRVPGISIETDHGVGNGVTVRGLGPEFNTVTVNGRTIATDTAGREFNFDILPSELITGAEVYKSPQANLNGASIGATINVQTIRPLEQGPGLKGGGSLRGTYQDLGGDVAPSGAAYASWRDQSDRFGASLVVSYDERDERFDDFASPASAGPRSFDDGYYGTISNNNGALCVGTVANGVCNARINPQMVTLFRNVDMLHNFNNSVEIDDRKRVGADLTLQWKPISDLVITGDALVSHTDEDDHSSGIVPDFSGGTLSNQVVVGGTTTTEVIGGQARTVQVGGRAVSQTYTGGTVDEIVTQRNPDSTTTLFGVNAKWTHGPFIVALDVDRSEADYNNADALFTTVRLKNITHTFDTRTGSPIADFTISSPTIAGNVATDVNNRNAHYVQAGDGLDAQDFKDVIKEVRLDGSWDGGFIKLFAGAEYSDRTKTIDGYDTANACAYCGSDVLLPASLFTPTTYDFFGGQNRGNTNRWVDYDPRTLFNTMLALNSTSNPALHSGNLTPVVLDPAASSQVEEKVAIGYLMGEYKGFLWRFPIAINGGVRYESTDLTSDGAGQTVISARPNGAGQNIIVLSGITPLHYENHYSNVLPSVNIRLNLTKELVFRVAASKVISRPTLTDLSPAQSISSNPGNEQISRGNPDLSPFSAKQAEAGLEWYYNANSLVSGTFFYKDIASFISRGTGTIQADQVAFVLNEPVNGQGATVKGVELSYRSAFRFLPAPFDGFGLQLSYTYTDSSASYQDIARTYAATYSLQDLSKNSVTAVGFYEKGPLQVRVSYSYRDGYLVTPSTQTGVPEFNNGYDQLDAGIQYAITPNLFLTGDVTNITDSREFTYSNVVQDTFGYLDAGRRFTFGVRARF